MDVWLERLDRFLTIIRPKAYNVIARITIGLGIVLVAESQLNIVQALAVAAYESLFGHSEILQKFMQGSSSPLIGLFLIVMGLIYHYLMTVGKEQIEFRLPENPELYLKLLNADSEQYEGNTIDLRGCILEVPLEEEIPEYKVSYNLPNMEGLARALNTLGNMERNPGFYQERGEFLKVWGGSELISLKITNSTKVLATGVKVEIRFPRIKGVSADNTKDGFPSLPNDKATHGLVSLSLTHQPIHYDIRKAYDDREYCFYWNIDNIQANTSCVSDTYIFLRSEESFEIEIKIYCDQFPYPVQETYTVNRKEQRLSISIDELMLENTAFNDLVDKFVMDGYMQRVEEKKLAEYKHKNQELIP